MRFTAIAIAPLPDIDTARQNHDLRDLCDEDVGKVLFHRRKQQGQGERLGWDQQRIGAVSMVHMGASHTHIESISLHQRPETELLDAIFRIMRKLPPLVTWGGRRSLIPLLQFRSLVHRRSAFDYWTCAEGGRDPHIDLQVELLGRPELTGAPSLDDIAQRLSLPGMLGHSEDRLWDQWLAGNHEAASTFADYEALNTAMLALEINHLKGRCARADADALHARLVETVSRAKPAARYWDWLNAVEAHDPT